MGPGKEEEAVREDNILLQSPAAKQMTDKETGGEKRKQPRSGGAVSPGKKKARDGGVGVAATDDEVEEFFAILRQIHVAVRYFKSNSDKFSEREKGSGCGDAMLEWASDRAAEEASGGGGGKRDEVDVGLDLNMYPGPDFENPV